MGRSIHSFSDLILHILISCFFSVSLLSLPLQHARQGAAQARRVGVRREDQNRARGDTGTCAHTTLPLASPLARVPTRVGCPTIRYAPHLHLTDLTGCTN